METTLNTDSNVKVDDVPNAPADVPVSETTEDLCNRIDGGISSLRDSLTHKIQNMQAELEHRQQIIRTVSAFQTFENFVAQTTMLRGKVEAHRETLQSLPTSVQPSAAQEGQ